MSESSSTDLWLERLRLNGMILGAVSYGAYFLLTIQATLAVLREARRRLAKKQIILLFYIFVTFILATIGFASNVKYTQIIWVDNRDTPGGPPILILTEMNFRINRLALSCYYIMEWFMSALLLYRCFVVWDRSIIITPIMSSLFLGSIAMSILVLVQSRTKNFYDIHVQTAYLSLTVGTNILYTVLVVARLSIFCRDVARDLGQEHARTYISVMTMIVESAAMYSILGVLFIASFALKSDCSNLIFLSISHVQGIAQLLIILRVAEGRAYAGTTSLQTTRSTLELGSINFDRPDIMVTTTVVDSLPGQRVKKSPSVPESMLAPNHSRESSIT